MKTTARKTGRIATVFLFAALFASCQPSSKEKEPRQIRVTQHDEDKSSGSLPHLQFTDVTRSAGIDYVHMDNSSGDRWMPETFVGGIAFIDFDRDDLPDIFAYSGSHNESAQRSGSNLVVYKNLGNGTFRDVTEELGIQRTEFGFSLVVADLTSDGWPDLYLSVLGSNVLLQSISGEQFVDISDTMNVSGSEEHWSLVTNASDIDQDGDLDLIVGNYVDWSRQRDERVDERFDGLTKGYSHPNVFDGTQPYVFKNNYPDPFTDSSVESGLASQNSGRFEGKVLGILSLDINNDGATDFLFANDSTRNFLFRSRAEHGYEEVADQLGFSYNNLGQPTAAMGIDNAWLGQDLSLNIAIGNFSTEMSSFYRYSEPGIFTDISPLTGIGVPSRKALTFGVIFADIDLDGRQDFLQVNGHVQPDINDLMTSQYYAQSPQVFWNCGASCSRPFKLLPSSSLGDLATPLVGRGLAAADYDSDGDLDLLISSVNGSLRLLRNDQTTNNNWLRIKLENETGNPDGFGAVVEIRYDGHRQRQQVKSSNSYVSQSETIITFGLGQETEIEDVKVVWPDGSIQHSGIVSANQVLTIRRAQQPN